VDRSLRRGERRLRVMPAHCAECGFEFRGRAPRHFHKPSRCPRCRSEHVLDARFRVVPR
jgi:predicted Zn-ribbon and HTH transcriptional regulator